MNNSMETKKEYEELRKIAEGIAYNAKLSDVTVTRLYGVSKKELLESMVNKLQETLSMI